MMKCYIGGVGIEVESGFGLQSSGRSLILAGDGFLLPAEAVVEEVHIRC